MNQIKPKTPCPECGKELYFNKNKWIEAERYNSDVFGTYKRLIMWDGKDIFIRFEKVEIN